jgi:hypothetical protein
VTTRFTIHHHEDGRPLVELTGGLPDLKRYLNPRNPSSVTVSGTKAFDGRGNSFRLTRKEIRSD